MQVITPCSLQRVRRRKYLWQRWWQAQEYVSQPTHAHAQSFHPLNDQYHTEKPYGLLANSSDYSLFAGEGVSSKLTIVCLGLAIFKYHLGRVNKA